MTVEVIKDFTIIGLWTMAALVVWLIVAFILSEFISQLKKLWNGGNENE